MKIFSQHLLDELAGRAAASPRRRAHHAIHADAADPVQRFFVCANRDSYFRPHRHVVRSEMTLVVRGAFTVLVFDEEGRVTSRLTAGVGEALLGYEIPPSTWHTLLANTDGATFLEIKEGPYNPETSAEPAVWAPAEGDSSVPAFLAWARSAEPGELAPRAA